MRSKTIGPRSSEPAFRILKRVIFWSRRPSARLRLGNFEPGLESSWRLFAVCHNEGEIERLRDVLRDNEVDVEAVRFVVGSLTRGFVFPEAKLAILCDAEIFGRYQSPSARRLALRRSRLRGGRAPIDFSEIAEGDLVVHLEHGIGKYRGIQRLQQNGSEQEVVVLEFADRCPTLCSV